MNILAKYRPAFVASDEDWEVMEALRVTAESFRKGDGTGPATEAPSVRGAILFALTTLDTAELFTMAGHELLWTVDDE